MTIAQVERTASTYKYVNIKDTGNGDERAVFIFYLSVKPLMPLLSSLDYTKTKTQTERRATPLNRANSLDALDEVGSRRLKGTESHATTELPRKTH